MKAVMMVITVVGLVLLALTLQTFANVPGGVAAERRLFGTLEKCEFEVDIDPLQFLLCRINNKYKLVRIMARNEGEEIALSAQKDQVDYVSGNGQSIPGILHLAARDPEYWKSLDIKLREALAYAGKVGSKSQGQTAIFIFFPAEKIEALRHEGDGPSAILPSAITYRIDSVPNGTIRLKERGQTAK